MEIRFKREDESMQMAYLGIGFMFTSIGTLTYTIEEIDMGLLGLVWFFAAFLFFMAAAVKGADEEEEE